MAFEINPMDVQSALTEPITDEEAEFIFDHLDQDKVADEALGADDLDDQTTEAYKEIKRQVQESDLLTLCGYYKRRNQEKFDL